MGFLGFLKKKPADDLSFGDEVPKPPESMFPANSADNLNSADKNDVVDGSNLAVPNTDTVPNISTDNILTDNNLSTGNQLNNLPSDNLTNESSNVSTDFSAEATNPDIVEVTNSNVENTSPAVGVEDNNFELPDLPESTPSEEVFNSAEVPSEKEVQETFTSEIPSEEVPDDHSEFVPPEKPDDYEQNLTWTAETPKELFIAADDYIEQIDRIKGLKKLVRNTDATVRSWDEFEQKFSDQTNNLFSAINKVQEELILIDTELFER